MPDKKEKKDIQKKTLIDTPCESNLSILILFLKNRSPQKICTS